MNIRSSLGGPSSRRAALPAGGGGGSHTPLSCLQGARHARRERRDQVPRGVWNGCLQRSAPRTSPGSASLAQWDRCLRPARSPMAVPLAIRDERRQGVAGMAVEGVPRAVVAPCGSRVLMTGCVLHAVKRHAGLEREGHHGVPEPVRAERLVDARSAREAPHDPPGIMPVEPGAVVVEQKGARAPAAALSLHGGDHSRRERDDRAPVALANDRQGTVASLLAQVVDVGVAGLGDAKPVEREETRERVVARPGRLGGVQEPRELTAVVSPFSGAG